jgi:hypothetical protein
LEDNPEIVYDDAVPEPVPMLGVYEEIVPDGAVKLIVTELVVALIYVRLVGAVGIVVTEIAVDDPDVPPDPVAVNDIEYAVFADNPEIVYAVEVPEPVPMLGVYDEIVPDGAVKLIVTELVVALTNVIFVGAATFVVIDSAVDALDIPAEFTAANVSEYVVLPDNPEIV